MNISSDIQKLCYPTNYILTIRLIIESEFDLIRLDTGRAKSLDHSHKIRFFSVIIDAKNLTVRHPNLLQLAEYYPEF